MFLLIQVQKSPPSPKDFGTYMGWFTVSKRTVTAKIAIMFIVKVPGHPLTHLCLRPCFVLVGPPQCLHPCKGSKHYSALKPDDCLLNTSSSCPVPMICTGLKRLTNLQWLCLAGNSIKVNVHARCFH